MTSIASSIASASTPRLISKESISSQPCIGSSTSVAVNAPTETKAPWPKLSTSIRPNTSVRPLAMMKIIMPIASPAIVSVSQVGTLPTSGNISRISAGISNSGAISRGVLGRLSWLAGKVAGKVTAIVDSLMVFPVLLLVAGQRQAEQALLQILVVDQIFHCPGVHDSAVVHHGDGVAQIAHEAEILFDQKDRGVTCF